MNYIVLINTFWALRRSCKITNLQADLYFFLLHESNSRNWQNPFFCSNQIICASLGVSEKSIIAARISLKELGLIEYESGITKKLAPKYHLLEYCNKVSNQVSNQGSIPASYDGNNQGNIGGNILFKQNQKKQNQTNQFHLNDVPSFDNKNNLDVSWQKWVESWFNFYTKKNNGISPIFKGSQAKALKEIRIFFKKNAKENFPEVDPEKKALDTWKYVLDNHFKLDDWLRTQFDLTVILKKMNDIMLQLKSNGSGNSLRDEVSERIRQRFSN